MEKNNLFFEKLTPVNDSNISIYEAAIDFVFKNDSIGTFGDTPVGHL